jgi:inosose dehydratase
MMSLLIGNAPCSWGVEFANDPRNPSWTTVLDEAQAAGYRGIELGPIGFMPEDPAILGPALAKRGLTLTGGVLFRPFHNPERWPEVMDAATRTCRTLATHGAKRLVLIDSISPRRATTAGRNSEAERLEGSDRTSFFDRLRSVAKMGHEEFGLDVTIHAHVAGFVEFEDELEDVLNSIDSKLLGVCLDTGHSAYAGFDPVALFLKYRERISYLHFKDVDPVLRSRVIENRINFYDACAAGIFCNLGEGMVDFISLRRAISSSNFSGWATVEQDCDPKGSQSPFAHAKVNLLYLKSVGLA